MKQKPVINTNHDNTPLSNTKLFLLAGLVFVITLLCLSPAIKNGFTNWDDNAYVFENKHLDKPLPEAIDYFFRPHYFIGNYIPVTMIVYTLEYHAARLDPHFYHKVNLFIHLLNVLLVFWLMYLLSGKKPLVAALVALLFGVHPMHVESVAWIAELKDVLYAFFFIAGLIAYYKYLEKNQALSQLVIVFALFLFSTLSKPAALTFPFVLLLLDFYTGRKLNARAWLEKLPFLIIAVIFGVIAIKAQQADQLIHNDYTVLQRIFFASHSFLTYLLKLFAPLQLSIFYPYPALAGGQLPFIYYLAPLLVIALFYAVYRSLRSSRLIAFGFLFFFVNVILVLQLISVGDARMAERYTYISYLGLFFIAAMGFDRLYQNRAQKNYRLVAIVGGTAFLISCSCLSYARCKVWKNDETLAADLLEKFPEDRLALNNMGFIFLEKGKYEESIPLFTKAIALKPDYIMAYINVINAYLSLHDNASALKYTNMALQQAPQNVSLLNEKGYCLLALQRYSEAIVFYKKAIAGKKENVNSYMRLAESYFGLKDYRSGIKTLDEALAYEPDNYILLNDKGYMLLMDSQYTEAVKCLKRSLAIKPDYGTASANLANCYSAMDKADTTLPTRQ